jgi:ribosomal protein S18 acetylase RimI-like enzyme
MAMHNTCTPTMLKSVLNIDARAARALHENMVSQGVIRDGNQVVKQVERHMEPTQSRRDLPPTRPAEPADLTALSHIWHAGWHEAHAEHVPNDLKALRDIASLRIRLDDMWRNTDVVGPVGAPVGFCSVLDHEIYQFYVAPAARGTGAADALMQAGEKRIAAKGVTSAMVYVLPENARARAFYRRCGWSGSTIKPVPLQTPGDPYMLPCVIMTKQLK